MRALIPRAQLLARKSRAIDSERAYGATEIEAQLTELAGWSLRDGALERSYAFRDYYDTIAFVNALAWMVHGEDHHPDLLVGYNRCTVRFSTHSVNGISENDFICAAKSDAVFGRSGN
ncbi:MAG: 4a-hydroxytetrahydrobiopterin dehydratase [Burkholderiaceae bacterium]|nr:4a-hydroxytetrahydrobiopterin dehydratase [Burkholderiaceae bacterium]